MNELSGEPVPAPEPYSILVVEDEALIRIMVAGDLRQAGFKIIEAANADEALKVLRTSVRVDMVVTDIHMPGSLDGIELARRVRANWPELKIIIMSSEPRSALADIGDAFFGKPYPPTEFIDCVNKLLGKRNEHH